MIKMHLYLFLLAAALSVTFAIPSSLVEEIKSSELRENKVKRAQPDPINPEENGDGVGYFRKPTAIKRGTHENLKDQTSEQQALMGEWEQNQALLRNQFNIDNMRTSPYNTANLPFDDKSIADYDKGFRYATNKDSLDDTLENVLKSEFYGEPSINQYRYYGAEERRRRRRDTKGIRLKREVELSPEEVLALLSLYENNRQQQQSTNYRQPWSRYGNNFDFDLEKDDSSMERNDESWLDTPVYPHVNRQNNIPNYMFDESPQVYSKAGRFGGFSDSKKKRFMVSKRSNDPTRMIRYLNGPSENDFNTLSRLLSTQREPKLNVPVYHRLVL